MSKKNIVVIAGHNEFTWDEKKEKGIIEPNGKVFEEFNSNIEIVEKVVKHFKNYKEYFNLIQLEFDNNKIDMSLIERIRYVNKLDSENTLIIDIHSNASKYDSSRGMWGFYGSTIEKSGNNSGEYFLKLFKKKVKDSKIAYTQTIKCIKNSWKSFGIILNTYPIAVLLELGFFTNTFDREILKTDEFKSYISDKIFLTTLEFYNIALENNVENEMREVIKEFEKVLNKFKKIIN